MKQLTEKQAIAFYEHCGWEGMTKKQIAEFQLMQDRLCVPFVVFHEALESTLKRPVCTHEIALSRDALIKELRGESPALTFDEIIYLIPKEKLLIIFG